jgi:hypothetical protein
VVPYDKDCAKDKGWTWGNDEKTQVIFCKEACDTLKSGVVIEISATYGCNTIVV